MMNFWVNILKIENVDQDQPAPPKKRGRKAKNKSSDAPGALYYGWVYECRAYTEFLESREAVIEAAKKIFRANGVLRERKSGWAPDQVGEWVEVML